MFTYPNAKMFMPGAWPVDDDYYEATDPKTDKKMSMETDAFSSLVHEAAAMSVCDTPKSNHQGRKQRQVQKARAAKDPDIATMDDVQVTSDCPATPTPLPASPDGSSEASATETSTLSFSTACNDDDDAGIVEGEAHARSEYFDTTTSSRQTSTSATTSTPTDAELVATSPPSTLKRQIPSPASQTTSSQHQQTFLSQAKAFFIKTCGGHNALPPSVVDMDSFFDAMVAVVRGVYNELEAEHRCRFMREDFELEVARWVPEPWRVGVVTDGENGKEPAVKDKEVGGRMTRAADDGGSGSGAGAGDAAAGGASVEGKADGHAENTLQKKKKTLVNISPIARLLEECESETHRSARWRLARYLDDVFGARWPDQGVGQRENGGACVDGADACPLTLAEDIDLLVRLTEHVRALERSKALVALRYLKSARWSKDLQELEKGLLDQLEILRMLGGDVAADGCEHLTVSGLVQEISDRLRTVCRELDDALDSLFESMDQA